MSQENNDRQSSELKQYLIRIIINHHNNRNIRNNDKSNNNDNVHSIEEANKIMINSRQKESNIDNDNHK